MAWWRCRQGWQMYTLLTAASRSACDPLVPGVYMTRRCMMDEYKRGSEASLGLVQLMTKEEQLCWAARIKPHIPHCITILPTLKHVGIFCLEEDVAELIKVLGSLSIINWQDMLVHHIPPYLVGPLQRLAEQKGARINMFLCLAFTYDPHLDTEPLRLGPGFRLCRLGRAGVRHVWEKTMYNDDISLDLMYILAQRVPYVGVYQDVAVRQETIIDVMNLPMAGDEEVPVAWCCSSPSGDVAKVRTEEDFRRYGLGSFITTILARHQAAHFGFIPHAFIHHKNSASRAMFSRLAAWNLTHDAIWMSITKPEENLGRHWLQSCVF